MTSIAENTSPEKIRRLRALLMSILCTLGATAGGYYLYLDFHWVGNRGDEKLIATMVEFESQVKRKSSSSFVWERVHAADGLHQKDSIQSGPNSSATIEMRNGSRIELGENSLVILDDVKDLSLSFLRGTFILRSEEGDKQVEIAKDGSRKIAEFPIRLATPESHDLLFAAKSTTLAVPFTWKTKAGVDPAKIKLLLQVASHRAFPTDFTQNVEIEPGALRHAMPLAAGQYYWRILQDGIPSETRSFRIESAVALEPIFPTAKDHVTYSGERSSVNFRWNAAGKMSPERAHKKPTHQLEIARAEDFKDIVATHSVAARAGFARVQGLSPGHYFWRLRSEYGNLILTGSPQQLDLEQIKIVHVELEQPADGAAVAVGKKVGFHWSADVSDAGYVVEIQPMDSNNNPGATLQKSSASNTYFWDDPSAGVFRWRILASSPAGAKGESTWRFLSLYQGSGLSLVHPPANGQIYYWDAPVPFEFSWKPEPLAERGGYFYQLELADNFELKEAKFSDKIKVATLGSGNFGLSGGKHFWRVKLVDKFGRTIKLSDTYRFDFGLHPPLGPVVNLRPAHDTTLKIKELEKFPALTWDALPDAVGYEVTLRALSDGKTLTEQVSTPTFKLEGLGGGAYEWSVRPVDRLKRLGAVHEKLKFNLDFGPVLSAPEDVGAEVR